MTWQISGRAMEVCSCKSFCPCWLGPQGEPDQGWCSIVFGFAVEAGNADGIELGGTKVAMLADFPGNFFGGEGTARLYIDDAANDDQRQAIESIFSGKSGGFMGNLWDALFNSWLPTKAAKVDIGWGQSPSLSVSGVGETTLAPLTDGAGKPTMVSGAMAQAALQIETMNLASIKNSRWSDSDLRNWTAEDGVLYDFKWSS